MKKNMIFSILWLSLLLWGAAGCSPAKEATLASPTLPPSTVTPTPTIEQTATATPVPPTPSATPRPTQTATPTGFQLALPAVTLSTQEAEAGLLALLRTNGNCTGKCLGGIRPDEMTVQEAVDVMSQWSMVRIGEDSLGRTFLHLEPNALSQQIGVFLSVGTWTKEFETIDDVILGIQDIAYDNGDTEIEEEVWRENWETWQAVRFDNLVAAYGVPSFVGFDFTLGPAPKSSRIGRTFEYGMAIQYEQTNMDILIGATPYYDGSQLIVCPSSDPHHLNIKINPERPLSELQQFTPITWEELTGTDLEAFYQYFTATPDACIETTLEEIQTLDPP